MGKINLLLLCLLLSGCYHCHEYDHCDLVPQYPCTRQVDCFGHDMAHKYGLKFLILDDSTNLYATNYCLFFSSNKKLELRQGRRLALSLAKDFLDMMNVDPGVTEDGPPSTREKAYIDYEPTLQSVAFKITFWDEAVNRPKAPYLAEILFSRGMIYYYVADPTTQELREEFKESYKDAMKNSKYQRKDWMPDSL